VTGEGHEIRVHRWRWGEPARGGQWWGKGDEDIVDCERLTPDRKCESPAMGLVRSVPQSVKSSTPLPLATLRPTTAIGLESWTGPVSNHKEMTVRRKLANKGRPVCSRVRSPEGSGRSNW
jgi:hypothetical protein